MTFKQSKPWIAVALISLMALEQLAFPIATNAQAQGGGVISRAATRAARIAAANAKVAAAAAELSATVAAQAVSLDPGASAQRIIAAQARLSAAAKELADANTSILEDVLDILERIALQTLKRRILDVMVDQVVNWIENGEEPRFVSNWGQFFGDIANGAAGEFVQNVAPFLCSPFSLQVRVGLLPVKRFGQNSPYTCTLDKVVSNVENFYQDFRNGGWIAYNEASKMQNNYYGALWLAWNGRDQFVASRVSAANEEVNANRGFLAVKLCRDNITHEKVKEGTPNSTCETTTPGGFVGAALEKTVGVDFDFIINAQELGDYAAAIVNALINRVIKEGVNGLRGLTGGQKQGAGGSYYSNVANLPATVNNAGSGYTQINRGVKSEVSSQLSSEIQYRTAAKTALASRLTLENQIKSDLQTLFDCRDGQAGKDVTFLELETQKRAVQNVQGDIDRNNSAIQAAQNLSRELDAATDAQFTTLFPPARVAVITQNSSEGALLRARAEADLATAQNNFPAKRAAIQSELTARCGITAKPLPIPL